MTGRIFVVGWLLFLIPNRGLGEEVKFRLAGDWEVHVSRMTETGQERSTKLFVDRSQAVDVRNERHPSLPLYNARTAVWLKGIRLEKIRAQEVTTPYLLEPASVTLRSGSGPDSATFLRERDFELDDDWGTVGRLPEGRIEEGQPVFISYRYVPLRLDSIVLSQEGDIELRRGIPRAAAPHPPAIVQGERRLANIWLPGRIGKLAPEHLFPVLERSYPEPPKPSPTVAEQLLPRTLEKLSSGEELRILAWGDSVTDGSYVSEHERWQVQFVAGLKKRYTNANIMLVTEAWGGRNTSRYLAEPPGSEHNFREKVLGAKPDLVVSEFVNDAGLNPQQVEQLYAGVLSDFRAINAEWIILTPHYVRPDWMGLTGEREVDVDPRPYTIGLRQFSQKHRVALADASLRYGRLWRQGIPYSTLMLNSINHPDARGMAIFADALMQLFP